MVYTADGKVLLLERTRPVFWQSVTGSLRWPDETPMQAAVRELQEETGITDTAALHDWNKTFEFSIMPELRARYAPGVEINTEHIFSLELPRAQEITINTNEHSRYAWMEVDEAREKMWSWTNLEALDQIIAAGMLGPDTGRC